MSVLIPEKDLPLQLAVEQAVEAAYTSELAEVASKLLRGLPALIECDKDLAPYVFVNVRTRLKAAGLRCLYLDGRPRQGDAQPAIPTGLIGTMIAQLREAVRGSVEKSVVVLPHLDLLTTSQGGLTAEAREVIPLLYENPELVWLGFKDPSFSVPRVIENLFLHRCSLVGLRRDRLRHLVVQKESRKFGKEFNPWGLYKHVSGVNAARLRKLLSTLEGEDYPADPKHAYRQLRQATLVGQLEVPTIDLDKDIGGYAKVKKRLRAEILDVLSHKEAVTDAEEVTRLEELIPKGMIFWGPPGTGKTLFAKAMAASIGAAITVVSGPELKSKWVGESLPYEEEVFVTINGQARRLPIGELVEQHRDDDVRTWTVRDDGTALLAPVASFLRHQGPDYIDVLVTQTGRQVRVTGGHSLFVRDGDQLGEVFAEQIEANQTRIAVPLRLEAPETVRELNLLELLAGREDVRVQGYDDQLTAAVQRLGLAQAESSVGVAVQRLQSRTQRPPLTVGAFQRLLAAAELEPDVTGLSLYCWHRRKSMPAVLPLTEELGEFLGKWVADGCHHRTGVRLALHEKEVPHYQRLCERLFGHVTLSRKGAAGSKGVDLVINSTLLRHVMKDGLEMPDGSARKRVPSFIFLAPRPVIAAFLRGYFSGDGTFTKKYIEASTVSHGLANDVVTLLQVFGIAARVRTKKEWNDSVSYRVRFVWTEFLRRFVEQIGFSDPDRNQAVCDYLANIKLRRKLQTPEGHITNDVLWDLVVEKRREPYSRPYVYDLSVPETERFIAGFGNVLVHNSEENLRRIFYQARQSAPSIIVFDELDSFATARGTYTGSGVEHSMVNQLLTEMDGFHKEEMVFVVGTTNFAESLDPALLRPGRFEFHLHIPYPEADDRREIIQIYDRKMRLAMSPAALDFAVKRTGDMVAGSGTRYSGDHINALCRAVARIRLREKRQGPTEPNDIDQALTEWVERPKMTPAEERVLATHEAGHAVVALFCPHAPPIDRVTIASENHWAFGYVKYDDPAHKYIQTRGFLLDLICVALGAREAELLLLDDLSVGATSDLAHATYIAREMVEVLGLGGDTVGIASYRGHQNHHERAQSLSPGQLEILDRRVNEILDEQRRRAAKIVLDNRPSVEMLRDLLLEHKTIDAKSLGEMLPAARK